MLPLIGIDLDSNLRIVRGCVVLLSKLSHKIIEKAKPPTDSTHQAVAGNKKKIKFVCLDKRGYYQPINASGGKGKMWPLFGESMEEVINELNEALAA